MKVELIKYQGKPCGVACEKHCFGIVNGELPHDDHQRLGANIKGTLDYYYKCYSLCKKAWDLQKFDDVIDRW
jgi:hypothetical protein